MSTRTYDKKFDAYIPIAKGIAETFGSNCEVVVHDFSQEDSYNIIAIFNGHVTGRSVGVPVDSATLERIEHYKEGEDVYNYTGKGMGRELKSTTMFIKDDDGHNIGCICINYDITDFISFKSMFEDLMKVNQKETEEIGVINKVNDMLFGIVDRTIREYHRPVMYLTKDEKVDIVKKLEEQEVFLIKGAVDFVAEALQVSRYTIYNYLDIIREN